MRRESHRGIHERLYITVTDKPLTTHDDIMVERLTRVTGAGNVGRSRRPGGGAREEKGNATHAIYGTLFHCIFTSYHS